MHRFFFIHSIVLCLQLLFVHKYTIWQPLDPEHSRHAKEETLPLEENQQAYYHSSNQPSVQFFSNQLH